MNEGGSSQANCRGPTERNVLVAAPRVPEAERESGSRRSLDALEFFLDLGWKVTVAAGAPSRDEREQDLLRRRGVEILIGFGEDVRRRIAQGVFSLAWVAFWHTAERLIPILRSESPETRIVVDSVDLHFLRRSRERFLPGMDGERPRPLDVDDGIDWSRELNAYGAADAVVAVSAKESSWLDDFLGRSVSAFCWPDGEDLPRSSTPFSQRRGILFVGSFLHPPNRDGLRWMCREVLPRVEPRVLRRHPLMVVGHGVDSDVEEWVRAAPGAKLVGWVPALEPYWERCRISAVPLRFGAGTKRKLLQSAMVGLPAVSTAVGVEGLGLVDGKEVLVADSPGDFAEKMSRLTDDQELWEGLARRARRRMLRRHSRGRVRKMFVEIVERVLEQEPNRAGGAPPDWIERSVTGSYRVLAERLRTAVEAVVPEGATVAVVSRGDADLLRLGRRVGWHFPRRPDGVYAGFHPPDDGSATAQLREQVENGARFLVFPATSLWWLDHYRQFAQLLSERCKVCFHRPETGLIYSLESLRRSALGEGGSETGRRTD